MNQHSPCQSNQALGTYLPVPTLHRHREGRTRNIWHLDWKGTGLLCHLFYAGGYYGSIWKNQAAGYRIIQGCLGICKGGKKGEVRKSFQIGLDHRPGKDEVISQGWCNEPEPQLLKPNYQIFQNNRFKIIIRPTAMLIMRRSPKRFTPRSLHLGMKRNYLIIFCDSGAREIEIPPLAIPALNTCPDGPANPGQPCGYSFSVIHCDK